MIYLNTFTEERRDPLSRFPCGKKKLDHRITELRALDIVWLQELSHGKSARELTEVKSEQLTKNRLILIRKFLGAKNTTQAVAEGIRRGIIK